MFAGSYAWYMLCDSAALPEEREKYVRNMVMSLGIGELRLRSVTPS